MNGKDIRSRIVVDCPVSDEGNEKSSNTLQDEDPRPSTAASNTVHLADTEGEETTKCTCSSSS